MIFSSEMVFLTSYHCEFVLSQTLFGEFKYIRFVLYAFNRKVASYFNNESFYISVTTNSRGSCRTQYVWENSFKFSILRQTYLNSQTMFVPFDFFALFSTRLLLSSLYLFSPVLFFLLMYLVFYIFRNPFLKILIWTAWIKTYVKVTWSKKVVLMTH